MATIGELLTERNERTALLARIEHDEELARMDARLAEIAVELERDVTFALVEEQAALRRARGDRAWTLSSVEAATRRQLARATDDLKEAASASYARQVTRDRARVEGQLRDAVKVLAGLAEARDAASRAYGVMVVDYGVQRALTRVLQALDLLAAPVGTSADEVTHQAGLRSWARAEAALPPTPVSRMTPELVMARENSHPAYG